ncbi:MAG TPA: chromosome partitioning protein ParB, partial [Actinomycetes bacterium]|nr:chromosome partitioning protein ParB [Actinomycetes bacterium]
MSRERTTARRGLGRGLGSLIPTAPAEEAPAQTPAPAAGESAPDLVVPEGSWFAELPAGQIAPN